MNSIEEFNEHGKCQSSPFLEKIREEIKNHNILLLTLAEEYAMLQETLIKLSRFFFKNVNYSFINRIREESETLKSKILILEKEIEILKNTLNGMIIFLKIDSSKIDEKVESQLSDLEWMENIENKVAQKKKITKEDELFLGKLKDEGNERAKELLILSHLYLIPMIIKKYFCSEKNDLEQEGFFGILKTAEKFDYRRGLRFSTFAEFKIRGAILDKIRDKNDEEIIKIPRRIKDNVKQSEEVQNETWSNIVISYEDFMLDKNYEDTYCKDYRISPDNLAIVKTTIAKLWNDVQTILASFPERDRIIFIERYGMNNGFNLTTVENVAEKLEIAQSTASVKINGIHEVLKEKLGIDKHDGFISFLELYQRTKEWIND